MAEHTLKIEHKNGEFTKDGVTTKYSKIVATLDGYMELEFDKSKDNYKNLKKLLDMKDTVKVLPVVLE